MKLWSKAQLKWIEENQDLLERWPETYPELKEHMNEQPDLSFFDVEKIFFLTHYAKYGKDGFIVENFSGWKHKLEIILTSTIEGALNYDTEDPYPFVVTMVKQVRRGEEVTGVYESEIRRKLLAVLTDDEFNFPRNIAQDIASCKIDIGSFDRVEVIKGR